MLKNLGSHQRALFLLLSATNYDKDPSYSPTMVDLLSETRALRATSTLRSKTIGWSGTFSKVGFHQFLTSGFVSTEESPSHPGGFTVFMFHPRSYNLGMKLNRDKSHICEHLGVKQSEDIINYFT